MDGDLTMCQVDLTWLLGSSTSQSDNNSKITIA
jgi:hypothetical protein